MHQLSDEQLEAMLERASEKGARKALAKVGLHDDDAPNDIRDLRDLLRAWNATRNTVWQTIVKWFTMLFLTALAAGVMLKIGSWKIPQ